MGETITLGDIVIRVTRKAIRNVHLSVHPPHGRVTLVAPENTRLEVARAYVISKLGWIREQQQRLRTQVRETPRRYVTRESHYVWGRRHLLRVVERDMKPSVVLDHRRITLYVRPGSSIEQRARVMHAWHKSLLHAVIPELIAQWEKRLRVKVAGTIRLNTGLVKKPRDLLEYVIVHEMAHLREPSHNERFIAILDRHYPGWREARAELNELALGAEVWRE
jgi:predicted metal-dependent hydrolase